MLYFNKSINKIIILLISIFISRCNVPLKIIKLMLFQLLIINSILLSENNIYLWDHLPHMFIINPKIIIIIIKLLIKIYNNNIPTIYSIKLFDSLYFFNNIILIIQITIFQIIIIYKQYQVLIMGFKNHQQYPKLILIEIHLYPK
jgi:hypothetical protein